MWRSTCGGLSGSEGNGQGSSFSDDDNCRYRLSNLFIELPSFRIGPLVHWSTSPLIHWSTDSRWRQSQLTHLYLLLDSDDCGNTNILVDVAQPSLWSSAKYHNQWGQQHMTKRLADLLIHSGADVALSIEETRLAFSPIYSAKRQCM